MCGGDEVMVMLTDGLFPETEQDISGKARH